MGFAKEGASVTIHGQSAEKLQVFPLAITWHYRCFQTTKDLLKQAGVDDDRVLLVLGSLEDVKTVDKIVDETVAKFGRIDVLVCLLLTGPILAQCAAKKHANGSA